MKIIFLTVIVFSSIELKFGKSGQFKKTLKKKK